MMKTRILCILLSVLMTAPLFSCAGNMDDSVTTDTTVSSVETTAIEETEETTVRLYPDVPDTNWNGEEFHVLGRDGDTYPQFSTFEVYAEEESGEVVNDAIFHRNMEIEEKYGVKIAQTLSTNVSDELFVLVPSGDTQYDCALVNQRSISSTAQRGELMDLYSLKHINFEQPWWNQEMNDRISIANRLYFTVSDFLLQDKQRTYIMYFNKDMITDYKLENPYELVRDGKWTIDKLEEMCDVVDTDLNGDGVYDENDQMGISLEEYEAAVLTFAAGNVVCTKDKNDLPVLAMNTEHMLETIDKVLSLISKENMVVIVERFKTTYKGDGTGYAGMGSTMFKEGKLLFLGGFMQSFKDFSANAKDEYGVLPYPMFNEEQEKHYTMSTQANLITAPVTQENADFTGFMLEVLSAYSSYTTLPAYYEVSCKTKYVYDPESAEMLDIASSGLVFDLCQLYDWGGLFSILTSLASSSENTFASQYAAKEASALSAIKDTVAVYEKLG